MPMMRLSVSLCRCLSLNAAREGEPVLGKGAFPSSVWPRCQKCLQVRWKIKDESPQRVWSLSDLEFRRTTEKRNFYLVGVARSRAEIWNSARKKLQRFFKPDWNVIQTLLLHKVPVYPQNLLSYHNFNALSKALSSSKSEKGIDL